MRDHPYEEVDPQEPEGGWVNGPTLVDSQVLSLTLCRFTGEKLSPSFPCPAREFRKHPDEDCLAWYHQAEALARGMIDVAKFEGFPAEIRVSGPGHEPTGVHDL